MLARGMHMDLTKFILVLGSMGCVVSAAAVLDAGCGGSSTGGETGDAAGPDSTTIDGSADVAPEAAQIDAGSDAIDAPSDTNDFTDIGDVQIDVPPLAQYPHAVTEAYCTRLSECCPLMAGQTWNQNGTGGCGPVLQFYGGPFNVEGFNASLGSGNLGYDASAAYACLHEFLSFNCGTISATTLDKVRDDCFGAINGTLAIDAGPCATSLECQPGAYCHIVASADGGAAAWCAPLLAIGQPCADNINSTDCTYLGNGTPQASCRGPDGGTTCQASAPAGGTCTFNPDCQSGVCFTPMCISTYDFSDPGTCGTFVVDAGAD
jgi:hypothetical protein